MSAYSIYTIENKVHGYQINEGTTRKVHCLQQGGKLKEFLSANEAMAFWNEIKENITPRDGWKLYKLDKVKTCDL
jgi:hypothetical protein